MQNHNRIQEIENHRRRLTVLREQAALSGISTAPHILIEIQDIECKLTDLGAEGHQASPNGSRDVAAQSAAQQTPFQPIAPNITNNNSGAGSIVNNGNNNNSINPGATYNGSVSSVNNTGTINIISSNPAFDEQKALDEGVSAISAQRYELAVRSFEAILQRNAAAPRAGCYCALGLMAGRSPNALSPTERKRVEQLLRDARSDTWVLPELVLALFECDYYEYQGQKSHNGISIDYVAQRFRQELLAPFERQWVDRIPMRRATQRRLGLDV